MTERDCNHCLWATRDFGCASWDCKYVNKQEAYEAWKEKQKEKHHYDNNAEEMH